MNTPPARSYTRVAVVIVIAAVVIAAALFAISHGSTAQNTLNLNQGGSVTVTTPGSTTTLSSTASSSSVSGTIVSTSGPSSTSTVTTSSQQSATCTITGQPGPIFLRVVYDSNQTPVGGTQVAATNNPAYCGSLAANSQSTVTFTTSSSTEWYTLNTENNAGYSFTVRYSGHVYNFTANLAPLSEICATLFIPSGRTSVSNEGYQTSEMACTSTTTTTSFSSQQNGSLTWYANYGIWNYAVTLDTNEITQGQNISATFTLTNLSNQNQTVDVDHPLVLPTIYFQNGTVLWTWTPPSFNEIENITAGQAITEQTALPTWMLQSGQSYILSSYPGFGTAESVNIGYHLRLNQTITVA